MPPPQEPRAPELVVIVVELGADLPAGGNHRVHVHVRGAFLDGLDHGCEVTRGSHPARVWGRTSSGAWLSRVIVAGGAGHACVPAGGLARLLQRNTTIPPFVCRCPT